MNNTKEEIQHFLEPYHSGMAVVEATRNWGLIYDWLDEVLDDVAPRIKELRTRQDELSKARLQMELKKSRGESSTWMPR